MKSIYRKKSQETNNKSRFSSLLCLTFSAAWGCVTWTNGILFCWSFLKFGFCHSQITIPGDMKIKTHSPCKKYPKPISTSLSSLAAGMRRKNLSSWFDGTCLGALEYHLTFPHLQNNESELDDPLRYFRF